MKKQPTKQAMKNGDLESGYTTYAGTPYHFEHIATKEAEQLTAMREIPHIVETINWTQAKGNKKQVHRNRYFTFSLTDAIGLAGHIEMLAQEIAEQVVCVRPVQNEDEFNASRQAFDHFSKLTPPAVESLIE